MNAIATASRRIALSGPPADRLVVRRASAAAAARWAKPPVAEDWRATSGRPSPRTPAIGAFVARRPMSTEADEGRRPPAPSAYAAVDHARSYEEALAGRHGEQLRLADDEGLGKDDPPYDPFDDPFFRALDRRHEEEDDEGDYDLGEEGDESMDEDAPLTDGVIDEDEEVDDDLDDDLDQEEYDEDTEGTMDRIRAMYNKDGTVRRLKSELAALRAGKPAGGLFAVIDLNGSQQKVTVDDLVIVNKLKPVTKWAVGNTLTLTGEDVLLVGSPHTTLVGLPGVSGAEVDVMVEEITRDAKVIVFKKRRRKHSQRKKGFRREVTFLRVLDIRFPERYAKHEHSGRES